MSSIIAPSLDDAVEATQVRIGERPITFVQYLDLPDPNHEYELTNGVLTKKMSAQLDHEYLQVWLLFVLTGFCHSRDMGVVLGSRTAVEVGMFGGRMPDLLFVSKARMKVVQQKAIFGPPDLVIEIVSPNDRISGLRSLEADYRSIGVSEIVFIDQHRAEITVIRRRNDEYEVSTIRDGDLILESVGNLTLRSEWILQVPRPDHYATLTGLLGG